MELIKIFASLSSFFPEIKQVKINLVKLEKAFIYLGIKANAKKYFSFILFLLFLSIIFSFLLFSLSLVFIFLALFVYFLPFLELERLKKEIESEMPIFLRNVGSLLKIGLPFNMAISVASRNMKIGNYMKFIFQDIEKGLSVQKAFFDFSSILATETTKRAIAQLISAYHYGGGEEIKKLGDDLLNMQRHSFKDFIAKSSIFSLFFIVFAIVAPLLYILLVLSTSIMENKDSGENFSNALLIIDVLFPLIGLLIIVLGFFFFPQIFFIKSQTKFLTLIPAMILAIAFLLEVNFDLKVIVFSIICLICFLFFIKEYKKIKEIEEAENNIGECLLIASTLPKGSHIRDFFHLLCDYGKGKIKKESCIAYKQLKHFISIEKVIEDFKRHINSRFIEEIIDVVSYSFKTGKDIDKKISELAEQVLTFTELKREYNSLLSMQRYSIILGMLLMPFIISSTFSLISSLEISTEYFSKLKISIIPAYMILMSSLSSMFLSTLENNKAKELAYFCFFVIFEMFIYFNINISIWL